MDDIMVYRPYRSHGWFVPFSIAVSILAFVLIGFCGSGMGNTILFLVTIGTISVWITKVLYDSANIVLFFEPDGLRIAGGKHKNYRYLPWKGFSYAYYARNYKGFLFAVLSPKALSSKAVKNFVRRSANLSRICVDFAVVVYIDNLQNASQLQELIAKHTLHVETY